MAKRPNAANITHVLAQLGGGSRKNGGGGMTDGLLNLAKTFYIAGHQDALAGKDATAALGEISKHLIEKK